MKVSKSAVCMWVVLVAFLLVACGETGEDDAVDGDQPDGDIPDGDDPDGDDPDGDETDGDDLDGDEPDGDEPDGDEPDGDDPAPLDFEAGFVELEPVDFAFLRNSYRLELTSSPARMWYAFHPADEAPEDKPLMIFFNGGPGSSTGILFGFNTAKYTLDPVFSGGDPVGENPHSWTELANLLYVDARQTGFSYTMTENVEDEETRVDEFTAKNFNCLLDGADFVRVLLRFVARHPALQDNKLILVGESYGGIRATVMLNLLLKYTDYAGVNVYEDLALVDEIQTHYDAVFPEYAGQQVPPQVVAEQFSHQVLVQPLLSGEYQDYQAGQLWDAPGSPMYDIATEEGLTFIPCSDLGSDCNPYNNGLEFAWYTAERDAYNYSKPDGWMDDVIDASLPNIVKVQHLADITGYDVTQIEEMYAENREDAYRYGRTDGPVNFSLSPEKTWAALPLMERMHREKRAQRPNFKADYRGDMADTFGAVKAWDRYYLSLNEVVNRTFYLNEALSFDIDPFQMRYGEMFLENLVYVESFITHAAYDLVIYGPAIPPALAMHDDLVVSTEHETTARDGVERPGWFTVHYKEDAFSGLDGAESRTVRFPLYTDSCHAVEITEPEALLDDVREWLSQTDE